MTRKGNLLATGYYMLTDYNGRRFWYDPVRGGYYPEPVFSVAVTGPSVSPTTSWPEYLALLDEPEPEPEDDFPWESNFHYMYGRDE